AASAVPRAVRRAADAGARPHGTRCLRARGVRRQGGPLHRLLRAPRCGASHRIRRILPRSPAMSAIESARDHQGDLSLDCDVVVVGSGAGGAVVATELAASGQRVLVLEEGPYVPSERLGKMRPSESMRHAWRDGAFTVAFGLGDSPAINVTMG